MVFFVHFGFIVCQQISPAGAFLLGDELVIKRNYELGNNESIEHKCTCCNRIFATLIWFRTFRIRSLKLNA